MDENFWYMSPLCPGPEMDAWEAIQKLHRELQQWAQGKEHDGIVYATKDIELWDQEIILKKGYVYRSESKPLAQIAWLNGPKDWPAILMQGRSYGRYVFKSQGKEYYLEPATAQILSLEVLS